MFRPSLMTRESTTTRGTCALVVLCWKTSRNLSKKTKESVEKY